MNRKIVALDLRGFGKSSYNNKCARFGDWASDVVEMLHLLKLSNIVLVGWSFGGAISQKVCELDPQLVSKLILTCSVSHKGLTITNDEGKICNTVE
jgi:pimeloyl-ACP methyl ester carboxylesterase